MTYAPIKDRHILKEELLEKTNSLVIKNNLDTPWEKDPEFIKCNQLLNDCNVFPKNAIYLLETTDSESYYDLKPVEQTIYSAIQVR